MHQQFKRNEIILPPIHPNAGLEASYHKQLVRMIEEMSKSVIYWLTAEYRRQAPRVKLAADASPAKELRDKLSKLKQQWLSVFDKAAPILAEHFAKRAARQVDLTLTNQLRTRDFGIDFKMTAEARNAVQAVIGENVALIRSIPQQYLAEVEGLVMRSIAVGGDLGTLTDELTARYGIVRRRAAFIARDQNAKANAVMTRVRQSELGVTHAKWKHSGAGKHPRPDHVAASGKTYEIAKGMYISGEWIWPGELPRCRCISQPILPVR
jgi:uncharacterized protein with gpF-like domain